MKAWQGNTWSWDIEGLSMHTTPWGSGRPRTSPRDSVKPSTRQLLKYTLEMDESDQHAFGNHGRSTIPQKKIALIVDEWGAWLRADSG